MTLRREMEEALAFHTSRAAEKMRRQGLATCSLIVFLTINRHDVKAAQYYNQQIVELSTASADTSRLVRAAMRGLAEIWRPGYRYKKAGVLFPELVKADRIQGRPVEPAGQPQQHCSHGRGGSAQPSLWAGQGACGDGGFEKGWKLRSEHLSQAYTTRWASC